MPVDPAKSRHVLVVHGVQAGKDSDQRQDEQVTALLDARMGGIPLKYDVGLYRYENINDQAQRKFRSLIKAIAKTPIDSVIADKVLDVVGDVVVSLLDGSVAAKIRKGLREQILSVYNAERPCYILAHSLGSIYAFDVINELMKEPEYFKRASRRTWPVQGLVTIGSPIGLGMFRTSGRRRVNPLGAGTKWFKWINYWDRTDPVVTGNIFGKQLKGYRIAEHYLTNGKNQGWAIQDRGADTGKVWLMAHVGYWENPVVGDGLVGLLTN